MNAFCSDEKQIIRTASGEFSRGPVMNEFDIPHGHRLIICGDTHGHLASVMKVFEQAGFPETDKKVIYVRLV